MNTNDLNYVQNHIDYRFKNLDLLQQAFIRRSYSEEHGGGDNEVLEFIGDKALDLMVVKFLSDIYGYFDHEDEEDNNGFYTLIPGAEASCDDDSEDYPNYYYNEYDEGELTEFKAQLVQKKTLADRIDYLGFAEFLTMNKSDEEAEVYNRASVKEDLFEAIIGAVVLDCNWDMKVVEHVVEYMLEPEVELDNDDDGAFNYIGALQDWALSKEGELPLYHVEPYNTAWMYMGNYIRGNSRPLNVPTPKYQCKIKLPGIDEVFLDFGDSQGEARMLTAKTALDYIEKHGLEFSIRDEIEDPNYDDSINQLETLARRGYFSIPKYQFEETHDENGNPIWDCECSIEEIEVVTHGESSSKKDAKKQAAFDMLQSVLEEE